MYQPCPVAGEVIALLNAIQHPRDRALLLVAVDPGLRRSELARLAWRDTDLIRGKLIIRRPKSGKERAAYVGPRTLEALRTWRQEAPKSEEVFGLRVAGVLTIVGRLKRRTGTKISWHSLRRFFARSCVAEWLSTSFYG